MKAKLGQNFRFGYWSIPAAERMRAIRRAGFDEVMLWWGQEYAQVDGQPRQLWHMAREEGLGVRTAHFPTTFSNHLWVEGEEGRAYERALVQALEDCGELGIANLVVHTTRKLAPPPPNQVGLERMGRALEVAQAAGVDIALENTRFLAYNRFLFDGLPSPRLKFCFDSGHANCFTPEEDPLGLFGDRLCTMHLHDNFGPRTGDQHHPLGDGTVDFDRLFVLLAALHPVSYNLESYASPRCAGLSLEEYLGRSYRDLAARVQRAEQSHGA